MSESYKIILSEKSIQEMCNNILEESKKQEPDWHQMEMEALDLTHAITTHPTQTEARKKVKKE